KAFDDYTDSYGRVFVPQSEPDAARWRAHKQSLFEHSGPITLQLSPASVFLFDRGTTALTTFTQEYRSGGKGSNGFKVLRWQLEDARWPITAETVLSEEAVREPSTGGGGE